MQERFYEPLNLDRDRDSMVAGLTYEQTVAKYPTFTDGGKFPADSYKGEYLMNLRQGSPEARVLWFGADDGFDWCVEIKAGGATLELIKG